MGAPYQTSAVCLMDGPALNPLRKEQSSEAAPKWPEINPLLPACLRK